MEKLVLTGKRKIMKNIIIGTAGHIDHGKTTLIKKLTGRNTDRWLEEQQRGITIDLGFTWFDLPDGTRAGIIDVPGHEKFIPNMVSGVVGMDLVLLVIAADEGIMPQTREHMDILNLLGVEKCIIVLNKCDLVEEEWLELMEEEIREEFEGTFLKDSPIVKVSAVSGEGMNDLISEISAMVSKEIVPKEIQTISRLPIDRVFTIRGFGTVVTGTLVSGRVCVEDTMELYPARKICKVRNLQVHEKEKKEAFAGQRVALNLNGIKKEEISRGCVLAPVDSMKSTTLLDVKLTMLDRTERTLENRMRLHLFTGTSEVLCRAVLLDKEELLPGESGFVQLRLESEVAVRKGDRFVVRFYSPMETIGGGVVLEPNPRIKKRFNQNAIEELKRKESGSVSDVLELHVRSHADTLITVKELAKLTALSENEILEEADALVENHVFSKYNLKKDVYLWGNDQCISRSMELVRELSAFEAIHPFRHGMKKIDVQQKMFGKIKPTVFQQILLSWEEQGIIRIADEYICTPEFEIIETEESLRVRNWFLDGIARAGMDFQKEEDLLVLDAKGLDCPAEIRQDICTLLREEGKILRSEDGYLFLKETMDTAAESIRKKLEEKPVISISEARDLFQTSRKNAKMILSYTETVRVTRKGAAESEWVRY